MRRRRVAWVLALPLLAVACGGGSTPPASASALSDGAVTVASFDFAESELVAELYSQALEAAGIPVVRAFDLGPRELAAPALLQGLVEVVPEYAGTALRFLSPGTSSASAAMGTTHAALDQALAGSHVTALTPAPAQDANAFVVTAETADRDHLQSLSDLRAVAGDLTFGGPPECRTRPLCLDGLRRVYGAVFGDLVRLDAGGPLTHQALDGGYVDVALLFTTDPAIERDGLVELEDDRGLQPAENVTPLVRDEVIDRWGDTVVDALDGVSGRLTTADLRDLNGAVQGGAPIAEVARAWLEQERLA